MTTATQAAPPTPVEETPADPFVDDASSADAGDHSLVRVRILVIAAGFTILGAAAGDIFDQVTWTLVVAPIPAAAAAWMLVARRGRVRLIAAAAATLLAVVLTVVVAGGSAADVVRAFTSGVQGLLSTEWPSPRRPDLLGAVAAVLATACAISTEIATRRRFHLLGLVPLLVVYLGIIALSAPLGVTWSWLIGLATVSVVFALLRNDAKLTERLVLLRGERGLLALIVGAGALVTLVAVPVSLDERADPRRSDPAEQTAPLLDPIEATLALRDLDEPRVLHVATPTDGRALPARWRTAALSIYDGRRWSPNLTLRPIGTTLGPAADPTISADVSFLDDNLTLVPLPGPAVEVGAAVETDAGRTVVRLAQRPAPGTVIGVVANAPATASDAVAVGFATRAVDESTSGLTQLAEGLAGSGDNLERLSQLETSMRDNFVLDNGVQGGGLEQALIDRFLRDTQRGTSEQFATSFVLLVRSLGIEARVATGFLAQQESTVGAPGEPVELTSADALVWPEVQLADGRWLAYDPVPENESTDAAPPPPEPQVQTPAAPQPPIAPPPESDSESADDDEVIDIATDSALSSALTWIVRASLVVAIVMLPLLIVAGLIVGAKYRRRRRRLGSTDPTERIRGAWATATDVLVDAGMRIDRADTDAEIATDGTSYAPDASPQLRRLATMSSAATFGTPRHPELLADDAVSCLEAIEHAMSSARTRSQRLRWRLAVRSFRPATRSPVSD